eukprot:2209758-Amphidinium_carterae.1
MVAEFGVLLLLQGAGKSNQTKPWKHLFHMFGPRNHLYFDRAKVPNHPKYSKSQTKDPFQKLGLSWHVKLHFCISRTYLCKQIVLTVRVM